MRGVLINARSIKNKFRELQALVTVNPWDIIAIIETSIHSQDRDFIGEFRLNGYCLFNKDRINKEGGGVLLYIRETLKPTEINLVTNHKLICIYINSNIKISLVLVYQKLQQNIQQDEDLYQTMGKLIENKISIIMGDLNSPGINWESLSSNNKDLQL